MQFLTARLNKYFIDYAFDKLEILLIDIANSSEASLN